MERLLEYTVRDNKNCISVENFLLKQGFSKQLIIDLKKTENGITVNGKWEYMNTVLDLNDTLCVLIKEDPVPEDIIANALPIDIIYEDEDILAVNKPSGIPTHPSKGNFTDTLANRVVGYFKGQDFIFRSVNRLDTDTSGLVLIAKNKLSAAVLNDAGLNRRIDKSYIALCSGHISEAGTVNAPISRVDSASIERIVDYENGQRAVTHFTPLKYIEDIDATLTLFKLETGRTHQIRVHMKHNYHPLLGDFLYNRDDHTMKRQALHAYSLSFTHPVTRKAISITAPLPDDMMELIKGEYTL